MAGRTTIGVVIVLVLLLAATKAKTASSQGEVGYVTYLPLAWMMSTPTILPSTGTPTTTPTTTPSGSPSATRMPTSTVTATGVLSPTSIADPSVMPTKSATPTGSLTSTATPTSPLTATPDSRFGVIVTGIDAPSALNALGLSWWYSYGSGSPGGPGVGVAQISVAAPQIPAGTLQSEARGFPGSYWIIGNEPNVPGQDNVTGDYYSTQLEYYGTTIKSADPTAKIVGPSVLNWDYTCTGCGGYQSGHSWTDSFRTAWANRYGGEPPIDVWALHAYPISWDSLPMTNASIVEQQVTAMSGYLSGITADQNTPIWLTEFGVIWGYDGYQGVSTGCVSAPNCIAPPTNGSFDTAASTAYLNALLPWFASSGPTYRLERWFLFTTVGAPESFTTVYGGISLLGAGATLTNFGQLYRQDALTQ